MKQIVARILASLLLISTLASLTACGEKKELTCDHCGKKIEVDADSNMEEDWILYCDQCNEKLFGDDPLLGEK